MAPWQNICINCSGNKLNKIVMNKISYDNIITSQQTANLVDTYYYNNNNISNLKTMLKSTGINT